MRTVLISIPVVLLTVLSAPGQSLDWDVASDNVTAGGSMDIDVYDAPTLPVTIEVYVGETLVATRVLTEVPGSVSVPIPSGTSGETWRVRVTSGTVIDSKTGTVQ